MQKTTKKKLLFDDNVKHKIYIGKRREGRTDHLTKLKETYQATHVTMWALNQVFFSVNHLDKS